MPKNMKYDEVSAKAGSGKKKGASDYKKGAAETVKQEKKDLKKDMEGGMKNAGDVPGKKGVAKHHGNMPKKKGAGDYDVKKGSHDHPHGGPGRMGYTQNFGPARQNSYAKGAAKVAKIMGKGPADHIEGHPKPSEIKLDNVTPSGGKATDYAKQSIKDIIKSQNEYDANTVQTTQNLAELDSLKKVAQGKSSYAQDLYGRQYNSSMPLDGEHIGNGSNSGWGRGLDMGQRNNIASLYKEAKKIQGPRPTLD
tara:strand:- start:491 stop:1243 length:753 start_codon:yes stop_codon:yes gene_type:complete